MKKLSTMVVIFSLVLLSISSLPNGMKAYAQISKDEDNGETQESTLTMNDPELYQEAKDLGLTDEEIIEMDKAIDEYLNGYHPQMGVAAVIGVIAGIVGLGTANYQMGKYAAKQVHKRGILSTATYKKYRWQFRAGLPMYIGIPATLGVDDYFYGI